jgi:hypothetical protein
MHVRQESTWSSIFGWRERQHDFVLAVAIVSWQAERPGVGFFFEMVSTSAIPEPKGWRPLW